MTAFHFELVSPEKLLFSGEVESVRVPGSEGEFTVLKDHAPLMALMKPGIMEIVEGREHFRVYVRGGFADVSPQGLTILAEEAVRMEEVDHARLDAEIRSAEEDVADAAEGESRRLASEKLDQLRELKGSI